MAWIFILCILFSVGVICFHLSPSVFVKLPYDFVVLLSQIFSFLASILFFYD